jgi:excisionase family DNA binding protein
MTKGGAAQMRAAEQRELERQWINYGQAQTISGLSRTTIWSLIRNRSIKAAKIGRAVRIHRESLEEFMERQTKDAVGAE